MELDKDNYTPYSLAKMWATTVSRFFPQKSELQILPLHQESQCLWKEKKKSAHWDFTDKVTHGWISLVPSG